MYLHHTVKNFYLQMTPCKPSQNSNCASAELSGNIKTENYSSHFLTEDCKAEEPIVTKLYIITFLKMGTY